MKHNVIVEDQPIADQVMVKCSCGFRHALSFWDYDTDVIWEKVKQIKEDHENEYK